MCKSQVQITCAVINYDGKTYTSQADIGAPKAAWQGGFYNSMERFNEYVMCHVWT